MVIRHSYPEMVVFPNGRNDIAYFQNCQGEIKLKSDADIIIDALINFYGSTTDEEIEYMNYKQNKLAEVEYKQWSAENKKQKAEKAKEMHKGYVYIFKCADKYKIGFSNNVERRLAQLDTRPFKLELMYSKYFDHAWNIEQWLHKDVTISSYRIDGEWYSFTDEMLQTIIEYLEDETDEYWED